MAFASRVNLDGVQTEERNARSTDIDKVTTHELCQIINEEDETVAGKVRGCIPIIADAADALTNCVRLGGRVIYVGAGTSGRLGVLDASEIPPTYSAPPGQFVGIIAGGDTAIRSAVEGAEDSIDAAVKDLLALQLGSRDCLIGIAASGRTPYVLSSLAYAKSQGCVTIAIACAKPSPMSGAGNVDFMIEVVTGPEVVTGSTRMKAGTATKLVLNMLSTAVMIKTGKTFGNTMIDVKPSNAKLRQRAKRILRAICGDNCPPDDEALGTIIDACEGSVKLAAVVIERGVSLEEASRLLDHADEVLSNVISPAKRVPSYPPILSQSCEQRCYLCVDGGGSGCEAAIYSGNDLLSGGKAGPCNVTEVGVKAAVVEIRSAVDEALKSSKLDSVRATGWAGFTHVWIAIAGGDRSGIQSSLREAIRESISLEQTAEVRITSDIELPAAVGLDRTDAEHALVLVAETGSVAMAFQRSGNEIQRIGRFGGWGPLLGDDGSGFSIGREAIRYSLKDLESLRAFTANPGEDVGSLCVKPLTKVILDFYRLLECRSSMALLDILLSPDEVQRSGASGTKQRIAGCAEAVIVASKHCADAASIIANAQNCLGDLVQALLRRQGLCSEKSVLVLSGGLFKSDEFCQGFRQLIESPASQFRDVVISRAPACEGARYMAQRVHGR